MNRRNISASFCRWLRLQALCGAIILSVWLIYWAVDNPIKNVRDPSIYVLIQVIPTVFLLHPRKFLYEERRVHYHWPLHVIAILGVNCAVVVASAAVMFRVDAQKLTQVKQFCHDHLSDDATLVVVALPLTGAEQNPHSNRTHEQPIHFAGVSS